MKKKVKTKKWIVTMIKSLDSKKMRRKVLKMANLSRED